MMNTQDHQEGADQRHGSLGEGAGLLLQPASSQRAVPCGRRLKGSSAQSNDNTSASRGQGPISRYRRGKREDPVRLLRSCSPQSPGHAETRSAAGKGAGGNIAWRRTRAQCLGTPERKKREQAVCLNLRQLGERTFELRGACVAAGLKGSGASSKISACAFGKPAFERQGACAVGSPATIRRSMARRWNMQRAIESGRRQQ